MQHHLSFRATYQRLGILLVIGLLLAGCTTPPPVATGQPPTGAPKAADTPQTAFETSEAVAALMDALDAAGANTQWAGTVSQALFTVPGWLIRVNGQEVEVYEYLEESVRLADTARIAADGSLVGDMAVGGPGQPTFWAKDKLIVLFLGDTPETPGLLSAVLGDPLTKPGAGTGPAIVLESAEAIAVATEMAAAAATDEAAPVVVETTTDEAAAAVIEVPTEAAVPVEPAPTEKPAARRAADDSIVLPTNATLVRALKDVTILVGPGANYQEAGDLPADSEVKVTGISADGDWWRVVCPDGTEGSCWVTGDPKLTKPSVTP